jgi:hypothetical protein
LLDVAQVEIASPGTNLIAAVTLTMSARAISATRAGGSPLYCPPSIPSREAVRASATLVGTALDLFATAASRGRRVARSLLSESRVAFAVKGEARRPPGAHAIPGALTGETMRFRIVAFYTLR